MVIVSLWGGCRCFRIRIPDPIILQSTRRIPRYINYTINERNFTFHQPSKHIITKSVFSLLDDNYNPLLYQEIRDPSNQNKTLLMFNGIEDIRLYQYNNEIQFIGKSMNFSKENHNLMITGFFF